MIKILGYNYEIRRDKTADEIGASGRHRVKSQVIQVASDQCDEQKESTILHEIIEALNYSLELEIKHSSIMALEAGFYQTLKDNGVDLSPLNK